MVKETNNLVKKKKNIKITDTSGKTTKVERSHGTVTTLAFRHWAQREGPWLRVKGALHGKKKKHS